MLNTLLNMTVFCLFVCLFNRRWNYKTDKKIIRYVTFKNGSLKDHASEKVCENMIYCSCCFSCNSSWFVYCSNRTIFIEIIPFLCTFLFLSWSSRFRLKSSAIWNNLSDFFYFGEYVV